MKLHLELRAGEGGTDARLLVEDQANLYLAYAQRHGLTASVVSKIPADHG